MSWNSPASGSGSGMSLRPGPAIFSCCHGMPPIFPTSPGRELSIWKLRIFQAINPADLGAEMSPPTASAENTQTRALFADEAKRISDAAITIHWHRPSLHEADAPPSEPVPVFSDPESVEAAVPVIEIAGSATRGTILHKLMEEVLTGETQDTAAELERRATELLIQLGREPSVDPKIGIAPKELAATIMRTLNLPEIAALRPRLVPELTVFGSTSDGTTETLVSGIADAVAPDANDGIEAIIDWKSDVEMNSDRLAGLPNAAWRLS